MALADLFDRWIQLAQHFLASAKLRDLTFHDIKVMSEVDACWFFAEMRWGSREAQTCPACGEIAPHYFRKHRLQWRCRSCEHCFSVTSGTVFDRRHMKLTEMLFGLLEYVNAAKGVSALQLSQKLGVQVKTAATFLGKLRELLVVNADRSPLSGTIQVDGGHFGGKPRKARKRVKISAAEVQNRIAGKRSQRSRKGSNAYLNAKKRLNRRVVFVLRELGPTRAAVRTIVGVAKSENETDALALIHRYVVARSVIMSDENGAYTKLSVNYTHKTVQHAVEYATDDGVQDNQAESYYSRLRRMEYGTTHRITPTYLMDYAQEMAWREDTRRCTTREKIGGLVRMWGPHGLSRWWRGYSQGVRRGFEILLPDLFKLEDGVLG